MLDPRIIDAAAKWWVEQIFYDRPGSSIPKKIQRTREEVEKAIADAIVKEAEVKIPFGLYVGVDPEGILIEVGKELGLSRYDWPWRTFMTVSETKVVGGISARCGWGVIFELPKEKDAATIRIEKCNEIAKKENLPTIYSYDSAGTYYFLKQEDGRAYNGMAYVTPKEALDAWEKAVKSIREAPKQKESTDVKAK